MGAKRHGRPTIPQDLLLTVLLLEADRDAHEQMFAELVEDMDEEQRTKARMRLAVIQRERRRGITSRVMIHGMGGVPK
jgi:hypothetical protein